MLEITFSIYAYLIVISSYCIVMAIVMVIKPKWPEELIKFNSRIDEILYSFLCGNKRLTHKNYGKVLLYKFMVLVFPTLVTVIVSVTYLLHILLYMEP